MQEIHTLPQEEDVEIKDLHLQCLWHQMHCRDWILRVHAPMTLPEEKEAKRQRSEPTTPVSTSSRLPYEYDALMGITRVGAKEAEGLMRN